MNARLAAVLVFNAAIIATIAALVLQRVSAP
jgi:hypothetical protein